MTVLNYQQIKLDWAWARIERQLDDFVNNRNDARRMCVSLCTSEVVALATAMQAGIPTAEIRAAWADAREHIAKKEAEEAAAAEGGAA
jgi:hypothetical protein